MEVTKGDIRSLDYGSYSWGVEKALFPSWGLISYIQKG